MTVVEWVMIGLIVAIIEGTVLMVRWSRRDIERSHAKMDRMNRITAERLKRGERLP